jgi:hypothetical protein
MVGKIHTSNGTPKGAKNRENRRTGKTKTKKKNPGERVEDEKEKEKENVMEIPKMGPQVPVPGLGFLHFNAKPNTKQRQHPKKTTVVCILVRTASFPRF